MAAGSGRSTAKRRDTKRRAGSNGASSTNGVAANGHVSPAALEELLAALEAAAHGDFSVRLPARRKGVAGEVAASYNSLVRENERMARELLRVSKIIGREGRMTERAELPGAAGGWQTSIDALNSLIDDLVRPTTEVSRVISAVADGDLSQKMQLTIEGQQVKGEFLRIGRTVNAMVDQLSSFADEVTRVAREVGTEGKLGGQAEVKGVSGTWRDLTDSVNLMATNLTDQVRNIVDVTTAVARGDLTREITVDARGEVLELKSTVNTMVDQLNAFADEVTRVAREVGTEGKLGGQAEVQGVSGTWRDLTDNVNLMASNLTDQVRGIVDVTTAVASGDLSKKITVETKGEVGALADTINTMVDQLSSFADEVTRVAREVGTEGKLGGQAEVQGVSGTWRDLTDNVNFMARNLTDQVRNIADVTTAVASGDLSKKITVDAKGEILELKGTVNTMVDQLNAFAAEVTRVAKEVGTEGELGGQAEVEGVSGTWRDLTENVNQLASNLTTQVRNIAQVTTAVANGDLSQKITVEAKGEVAELADTINTMVDQLSSFAAEVTRVAREVGTEGELGGQAEVEGVSGTWRGLTDNVNFMASNLTDQVRNIAEVTTAVASGDLTREITVDARGEILELKRTINTMVQQLSSFADEVTRVAREVGTEGKLGGQAEVEGVSGTWRGLTENVNQLAGNLTTQVRAIAEVSTAVTQGDLTRSIAVEAQGEVAELKDNINQMIANLRDTTRENAEQDWLKTNLARISGLMQGQRDLETVSSLIMSELTPTVSAQLGAFFLSEPLEEEQGEFELSVIASYGYRGQAGSQGVRFGEGLVGQAAVERRSILVSDPPKDYIQVSSGLGRAAPANIIVLPVVFEGDVLAVIELASFLAFGPLDLQFLEQLGETIGVTLNTIIANRRTQELLEQSQSLTQELQSQSVELQSRQGELKQSNEELEAQAASLKASEELLQTQREELQQTNEELQEKAALLSQQNRDIEVKTEQLALSSKYKSEFLANMSHELRTPLNSMLILSKLLADNDQTNLSEKQVEHAATIHGAGTDLLTLINDILDLSKVEAGKMEVQPSPIGLATVRSYVERTFAPVAQQQDLRFDIELAEDLPETITTDGHRLQQVLKNLLSNAFKFTEKGGVTLVIERAEMGVAFSVADTGVGIPADKLKLIFEAFQQADGGTSRRYGGTGLGLSISREIARLLGGRIDVASAEGQGSRFTLELPLHSAAPAVDLTPSVVSVSSVGVATAEVGAWEPEPPAGEVASMPPGELDDDRAAIGPGDRVLLVAGSDPDGVAAIIEPARLRGFKVVADSSPTVALALAHAFGLSAVILLLGEEDEGGMLTHLKRHPQTRHVPVYVEAPAGRRGELMRNGALGQIDAPADAGARERALDALGVLLERPEARILVVADDVAVRAEVIDLVGTGDEVRAVGLGSREAPDRLAREPFDCVVLAGAPEQPLALLAEAGLLADVPVIVFDDGEPFELGDGADELVLKHADSPARLLDETVVHLHRNEARLPAERQRMLDRLRGADEVFREKRVLVVDDDVRNVFALANALETHGIDVLFAENGRDGIEMLRENPDVDLVLMDVMMPEMDGYQATQEVRQMSEFEYLPIVALTAKAMRGDREKSIASGASDYIAKPVDVAQLLSLMRAWLLR